MLFAATPLARFIETSSMLVTLTLAFVVMIGMVLIADGFGFHVAKGYIHAVAGFAVGVALLTIVQRNRRRRAAASLQNRAEIPT